MEKRFVHLHFHSEYSLLDGACRIKDIPKAVTEAGQAALAITDHGVMYGAVDFYRACRSNGIKPIIGCEIYVAPRSRFEKDKSLDSCYSHLVLLCKNETGYKNLIKIVSNAFTEGFYSKPRADIELLRENSEGLIALSACLGGYIPQRVMDGDIKAAREHALLLSEIFGKDGFYLELQRHGITEQETVNAELVKMSKELGLPLVATNDVHYLRKNDAEKQAVLMCIQTNTTLSEGRHKGFEKDEFYLKSTEEMYELFSDVPEALENTVKIAEQCSFDFCFDKQYLPAFYPPEQMMSKDYLETLCRKGLQRHIDDGKKRGMPLDEKLYAERLDYELSVVDNMGFDEYYLIVNDFITYAKDNGIPVGPGRGSGAGSLAAYCLGITDIDPIKFDLLFERFLNPERVSMPDFDVDFCYYRRSEVIDYVARKYGRDHVAQIVTFGTLAAKAAIRDVGRVLGLAYSEVDRVAKCVSHAPNITIDKALEESPELRQIYREDASLKAVIDIARDLEGMPRNASTHAAGVVITDKPVFEYVPLSMNGDCVVTQYTMNVVADLGLLKIDFLGLRYLTVVYDAAKSIGIDIHDIPLDDGKTYAMLAKGQSDGVFQLESGGMKSLLMRMNPMSVEDLTVAISLYRPGPMDSIPKFLANRKDPSNVKYADEKLEPILSVTNGCIVYQEQVMQIFRSLAGYSFGRADIVRRAMSKKKKSVMEAEREYFLYGKKDENGKTECVGAIANGVPENAAIEIYNDMATFAQYAFNKSHAASYAHLAYYTAYLKCHYPKEYMAALLTSVLDRTDKVMAYINVCSKMGVAVLNPDVNESLGGFTPSDKAIRFGLLAIKNVGESFVADIIEKRKKGRYNSFDDFLVRLSDSEINKRMIESLIRSGAFDSFGKKRSQLMAVYDDAIDALQRRNRSNVEGQFDMFSTVREKDSSALVIDYPDIPEFDKSELLAMEKEIAGIYMSGHPLEKYAAASERLHADSVDDINSAFESDVASKYKDGATVTLVGMVVSKKEKITKSDQRMAFIEFEDMSGDIELIVFPKVYNENIALLMQGSVVGIVGEISVKESAVKNEGEETKDEPKILVRSVIAVRRDAQNAVTNTAQNYVAPPENAPKVKISLSALRQAQNTSPAAAGTPEKQKSGTLCLYLKVPSKDSERFIRAQSVLEIYSYGTSPVFVYFEDTKKLTHAVGINCRITDTMLSVLSDILTPECVKTKIKDAGK